MTRRASGDEGAPGGGHEDHAEQADHGHADHGHADHASVFRRRFWVSLVLAVPVVLTSRMISDWFGYPVADPVAWVAPILGTVLFGYGGWPFLAGAATELRARRPGMMTLVALAISVAFVASALTTLGFGGWDLDFWWELALLIVIMLLGHWLEMRALGQASGALEALAELLPDEAELLGDDGEPRPVPLPELRVGDVVLVRSGGRVPADGTVVAGSAEVDESMVTGESQPVTREEGDPVVAGTVATDSALRVHLTAVGDQTTLAGIRRLVAEAQSSSSRAQALADRAAAALFYFALVVGLLTFAVWSLLGETTSGVERTVTVLVIACPHALGLAIPLVVAISTSLAARAGILVTSRLALERMRTVDTVVLDKTGTLTTGQPSLVGVEAVDGDAERVLLLAASAEAESEHPLARALVAAARERGELEPAADFRSLTGRGVTARVGGVDIAVGGPALLRQLGLRVPERLEPATGRWAERGAAVLHVVRDGEVVGAVGLADTVRPESTEAVRGLRAEGLAVLMITGDARHVAEAVGREVGVDEVIAEVLPEDKDAAITRLRDEGHRVVMVGDGVNDAPALARADVGIAIGAGTDVAIESAGVVLASDDPRGVLAVRRLSAATYRKMWQNLAWATGYNLVSVPLAAGVLAPVGFVLPPAVGAVVMSLSTIVVALNAQLLRRVRLRPSG
ncbi:heavy metal translocating P-type ATPase [Actinoalloteichus sp. AHMU CJ021]|uniref:heavy metal translocating P-type ATPase n=1 Tax=Actinoalloteichus sp. AHMU CJ021 TaxID=2072503 RepID=UPI0026D093D8